LTKKIGEMPTIAAWARNFVLKHPKYQKDSIVSSVKTNLRVSFNKFHE